MKVVPTKIPGLLVLEPQVFGDARGFFMESWHDTLYREAGIRVPFVQDNVSLSRRGVLRGLHLQNPGPQGKLVGVLRGEVFDVAVDVRTGSPTFGQWFGILLNSDNKHQLYVPPGMAHGFVVTSDEALFCYKCTDYYNPKHELTILWNDPDIGIEWPMETPLLSGKDKEGRPLRDLPSASLVKFIP